MSTSESATTAKSKPFIPSEKKPATPRPSSFSSVSARRIQVKAPLTASSAARRASDIPAPPGGGLGHPSAEAGHDKRRRAPAQHAAALHPPAVVMASRTVLAMMSSMKSEPKPGWSIT